MGWRGYDEVDLGLYTLRRTQASFWPRWSATPPGLDAHVVDFIERDGGTLEVERLLDIGHGSLDSRALAEHVRSMVEEGRLEVVAWSGSGSFLAGPRSETPLHDLSEPTPLAAEPVESEPAPTERPGNPSSETQASVLEAAANSATPFCEVCEDATAAESTNAASAGQPPSAPRPVTRQKEVAQLATFESAAEHGTPFCEVCTGS